VALGELRAAIRSEAQIVEQRPQCPVGDEHQRGVDDVLAGRAAVDRAGGGPVAETLAQRAHERRHRCPLRGGRPAERSHVE
jgi:hypothetical protein